jgi:hypothetical protein
MTEPASRPSGGGSPATLLELIEALVALQNNPDPLDVLARCPDLALTSRTVLARTRAAAAHRALQHGMSKAQLAREMGIHVSKIHRLLAEHSPQEDA